jgi:NADH:ubiquinone oxidoreductase subunit K
MSLLFALFLISVLLLFVTGIYSLLITTNLIRVLVSVEVLTKGVTLMMIAVGYATGQMAQAEAYVITIIVIEVVLLAIATGIVLGLYRDSGEIITHNITTPKE